MSETAYISSRDNMRLPEHRVILKGLIHPRGLTLNTASMAGGSDMQAAALIHIIDAPESIGFR